MLKKAFRLRTKEDFERVFRKGKPLFFGVIACKITPNTIGHLRIGFSFGKKYISKAAWRNRLKRVLSEPFSQSFHLFGPETSVDIIFFPIKKISKECLGTFASPSESVVKYICK